MGITVHEHLIIGENKYFSFADQGFIARMNREFDRQNINYTKNGRNLDFFDSVSD
jgi:hypothetical protein